MMNSGFKSSSVCLQSSKDGVGTWRYGASIGHGLRPAGWDPGPSWSLLTGRSVPRAQSSRIEDFLDVCHTEGIVLSTMGDKALPSRPAKATKGEST